MLKKIFLTLLVAACVYYLILPSPGFPPHPPGVFFSIEPADTESIYRRAYYTNLTRPEVMSYYRLAFGSPALRLNHPPEEAFSFIRDQTQSQWLEELVHPGRDALYINGYYPTKPNEQYNFNGVHYLGKVTVRYIPSGVFTRITVLLLAVVSLHLLVQEYRRV